MENLPAMALYVSPPPTLPASIDMLVVLVIHRNYKMVGNSASHPSIQYLDYKQQWNHGELHAYISFPPETKYFK